MRSILYNERKQIKLVACLHTCTTKDPAKHIQGKSKGEKQDISTAMVYCVSIDTNKNHCISHHFPKDHVKFND